MKNFKLFLVFMLLMTGLIPAYGSSAHFYAKKTSNTPSGAGEIYIYRGGGDLAGNFSSEKPNYHDVLRMPTSGWVSTDNSNGADGGEIELDEASNNTSKAADGYSKIDNKNQSNNTSIAILHMYFFARTNPGFQFDGWYANVDGTGTKLKGSVDHYPYPETKYVGRPNNESVVPKPGDNAIINYADGFNGSNYYATTSGKKNYISRWNNGTSGATPPGSGVWEGIHFMRHVEPISQSSSSDGITKYAKFSIIPRKFVFVGTGFNDVSYTAGDTNVGASTIESDDFTTPDNIQLSITYNANKYNFVKWQWSLGANLAEAQNAVRTDITTTISNGTGSATYTFVVNRGYPEAHYPDWEHPDDPITYDEDYKRVYIWPVLQEKQDAEATVQIGEADPVSYEHWADAFAAATADNVSGAIITLKKNITGITTVQAVDRNMTLNLNGFKITGSVNNMFTVSGSGTNFTLCDNSIAQAGRIEHNPADPSATTYALSVTSGARLTLTSGGVTATGVNNVENSAGSSRGVEIKSGATLVMSGGQISSQSTNNAYALVNAGTATISGGACDAYAKGASAAKTGLTARAFYNTGASVTIDGGVFTASADSSTTVCGIQHNNSAPMTINYAEVNVTVGKGNAAYDLYSSSGAGKIMVYNGKYKGKYPSSVAKKDQIEVQGGIYDSYLNLRSCTTEGFDCYELEQGADYNAGYRFVVKGLDNNPNVCKVITMSGTTYYSSLADAFSYVQANPGNMQSIIMTAFEYNFNVAGDYIVPEQTAFVVPYGAGQTGAQTEPVDIQTWANLSKYHSLTLGPGVNITVQGTFTVGGQQFGTSSSNPGPGSVVGSYAMLDMSAGGHLTIANGASLYAYGFIKGAGDQSTSGTITIQNGGTVYEDLVVNDMHGGGGTAACVNGTSGSNSYGLFPFSQYFIQNIEPRMTIEYGGIEKASYNIQSSQGGKKDMINVIGTGSDFLFQTSSGSTITKWYDATRDYQCYEVSGGMSMNGLTIDAGMASMSSSSFILPLNNNMDIHVKSGAVLNLPYALKLQAGAKLTIDEGAIVNVNNEMYIYDYQDWDKYAISYAQTFGTTTAGRKLDWHTLRDVSSAAKLGNADVIVNGQLVIKGSGALYTTSHGANITSTGSGKIIFNVAGKSANKNLYECWSTYGKKSDGTALAQGETDIADGQVKVGSFNLLKTWYIYGTPIVCNPAQLKNANGTFTSTSGAVANDVYQYCDGTWTKGGCVTYYTITWKSEDGNSTLETDADVAEGSATSFDGTTPSKATTAQYTYTFDGWATEANGAKVYEINGTPDVEGDVTYYAHFSPTLRSYTLTWVTDGDALTGDYTSGTVENGASIIAPNTPTKTGYTFAGWHNGTGIVTPSTMPAAKTTYTATWTINQYTLTVLSADEAMGTVTGGGTYDYNTAHTITATPKTGFKFVKWNDDDTNASREVTVTADVTYTATFDYDIANYTVKHWKQNISGDDYIEVEADLQVTSGTIGEQTAAVANTYPGFSAQDIDQQTIVVGGTTVVNIYYNRNPYTITFDSNGGSEVDPITQKFESSVTPPAAPTRDGYEFAGWNPAVPATMPANDVNCVAQWTINSELDVEDHEIVTVSETATVETTIVHEGGNLNVESGTLTTDVLIVEASASNSGQITGAGNVVVTPSTGKAYFDLTLNTPARRWHAFGVPWAVDLTNDPLTEVETGRTLTLGSHYEIVYYDTHTRATQGPNANCWKYLKHYDQVDQPIEEMTPGQGYMIAFTCSVQTVRFVKKEGAPVIYNEAVTVSAEGSGDNQGINALANPMAYHATLNAGPTVGYVHDGGEIGSDGYDEYDIDSKSFIVGKAVYIQVRNDATVVVEQSDAEQISKILAPARRKVVTDKEYLSLGDYYHVSISSATINGGSVYVLPEEDKEDKYVVGHDLAKFGMSTKKPQIWVNRYGVNLGLNTVAPINETAEFPVNLYAPTAGDYTITNNQSPMTNDEYIVYLTQNGEAIWNLSDAPYVTSLLAGVNKTYGLRLTARKSPTIATGVDEAVVDAKNEIRKVLIDEKVFIIREGNVYSIDGQLVK